MKCFHSIAHCELNTWCQRWRSAMDVSQIMWRDPKCTQCKSSSKRPRDNSRKNPIDKCMAKIYTTLFNEVLRDCQYLKAGRSIIYLLFRKFGFNTTRIATQCGAGEGGATQNFRSGSKFFKGKRRRGQDESSSLFYSFILCKNESVDLLRKGERENMSKKTVWTV